MTTTDTSTDPLHGFSPADIIVGSGGQTLTDAAASERTQTILTMIDGRPAHASVAAMLDAIATAATQLVGPFVVQFDLDDPGEFIVAVTDADDPDACIATDVADRRSRAIIEAVALLPTWARSSTHDQARSIGPITYARQRADNYSALHSHTLWEVSMDAEIAASLQWLYPHYSYDAASADEAAQLLWQHLGCPRSAGLMIVPSRGAAIWYDVEDWTIAPGAPYYAPVHAFPALTRAASEAEMPSGSDPVLCEIHRSRTTGARHASRIRAAQCSIVQYVIDECFGGAADLGDTTAEWVRSGGDTPLQIISWHCGIPLARGIDLPYMADEGARIIAAIAAMEMHGVGGPGGLDGGATVTMSWRAGDPAHGRRGLGKGRRQASDGQAWDAAIQSLTGGEVSPADVMLALPFVRPHDLLWPMAFALDRAYHHRDDTETSRAWCDVARAVMIRAQEPGAPLDGPAIRLGQRYGVVS